MSPLHTAERQRFEECSRTCNAAADAMRAGLISPEECHRRVVLALATRDAAPR